MSCLADRVLDVLRFDPTDWHTAVQVARQLGMNTAAGGERYVRAVANELCTAVDAGLARMRLADAEVPQCRYQIKEAN